jgi:Protein of unknown function (DUF3363)
MTMIEFRPKKPRRDRQIDRGRRSLDHRETRDGESIRGVYRLSIEIESGRFAMLDDGVEFSFVRGDRDVAHLVRELRGIVVGMNVNCDFSWRRGHSLVTP